MIVDCKHGAEGQLRPCPPMCPSQAWPRYMFRLTFFRGRWKLRHRYQDSEVVRRWAARQVAPR